jgi:hypothetical protein
LPYIQGIAGAEGGDLDPGIKALLSFRESGGGGLNGSQGLDTGRDRIRSITQKGVRSRKMSKIELLTQYINEHGHTLNKDLLLQKIAELEADAMAHREENFKFLRHNAEPIMEYMARNFHPHTTLIITSTTAELVEGICAHRIKEQRNQDIDIGNLLHLFWQRTSDACPLEAIVAEKQENEFKEWVKQIRGQKCH